MTNKDIFNKKVLVIEDNGEAREHLVEILKLYIRDVLYAENGCEGLEKINRHKPDIVVCDIKMPCLNGIDMLKQVKKGSHQPVMIITSAFSDKNYLLEALDMKVDAYLIKPIDVTTLIKKIEGCFVNRGAQDLKYKKLSHREYEVFLDIARGLKPSEIALNMGVKAKTVSTYRRRIFDKMGFQTNAELVAYTIENRLL